VLVDQGLEVIGRHLGLIQKNMIMGRARRTLNRRMRVQVEVVFERVSHIALHQGTRVGVHVFVASRGSLLGKETNVMALGTHSYRELDLFSLVSIKVNRSSSLE